MGRVIPMEATIVHDTWHVAGMKATGSNDVEVPVLALVGSAGAGADPLPTDQSGSNLAP